MALWPTWAGAATTYYLDPDVSAGTHVGTQANPWQSLNWTTINTDLATQDVTVYCSARAAGSDINQVWSTTVDVTNKTANPTGTLTLDGKSFWNSNDSTPNWAAYSGASMCNIVGITAKNGALTKYSKFKVNGFFIIQTNGANKGIEVCGDNWTIQNSNISQTGTGSSGSPTILIVPTADAAHEGTSQPCPAMSNITIQDNTIHQSVGELIYVGAAGCSTGASTADQQALRTDNGACGGMPSHSNITIQRNTLYDCGSQGGQGDCIDLKAGLTNVTIRQNDISNTLNSNDYRCIVSQGITTDGSSQNYVIERNAIHGCLGVDDAAVAFVDSWGKPNGIEVRNNLFYGITGGYAMKSYTTQATGVAAYNNTFYNNSNEAIQTDSGSTWTIRNNAMLANNSGGAQNSFSGTVTSDHNGFGGTWGGTCGTGCVSGLTTGAFTNAAGGVFTLTGGSALLNVGATLGSFTNDYLGTTRPQGAAWDIGAYESVAGPTITTSGTLPSATQNVAYSTTISGTCTNTPCVWTSDIANAGACTGVTFTSTNSTTATMGGTPTVAGLCSFNVTTTDNTSLTATGPFTITVNAVAVGGSFAGRLLGVVR